MLERLSQGEQLLQDQGPEKQVFASAVLLPDFSSSVSTAGLPGQELMSEVATILFCFIAKGFDLSGEVKVNWINATL